MECIFCHKKGHEKYFCPHRRSDPPDGISADMRTFAENLIALPKEDVSQYASLPIDEVMARVTARAEMLNKDNPWGKIKFPLRTDLLRAKLGFWKAIGADTSTLSWIAYGYKFRFHEEPTHLRFRNGP